MHRAIAILFVCGLALWGQRIVVQPDDSGKEGTLQILYVTSFGEPATAGVELTVENVANGKEVPIERTGTLKLPYGTYRLRARITAHYPAERIVKIQEPFQTTSLCFFEAPIPWPWETNLVRGRISEKSRSDDCRWVRLISLFADGEVLEAKAAQDGYFGLAGVRSGKYLLVTAGKEGICEAAQATIRGGGQRYDLEIPWTPLHVGEAKGFGQPQQFEAPGFVQR